MKSSITHFKVGNGNCSLIETKDFVLVADLNKTEDADSAFELLQPFFRKKDGVDCIDVLYITHGDKDHLLGFKEFKEKIDSGNLVIGSIWHQDFDRTLSEDKKDLPDDYLAFQEEINRRKDIENPIFGEIERALKAKDSDDEAFKGISHPDNIKVHVLSPFMEDDEDSGYNHNQLSLIINFEIDSRNFLYTGDSPGKYWQERIVPDLLDIEDYSEWAKADVLEVGHHGSFDFFGEDRNSVRDSEDEPDNYTTLDRIYPSDLIISASSKFPTSGDSVGDEPPHYAAWKWYHKWFRNNHGVKKSEKHPNQFKYTADGNIRIENNDNTWTWMLNWDHNEKGKELLKERARKVSKSMQNGALIIGSEISVPRNPGYYGSEI